MSSLEKIYFELVGIKGVLSDNIKNPKLHLILLEYLEKRLGEVIKKIEGE